MPHLEPRDTQTKVKHEILEEYLTKWYSIITYGLRGHYARYPQLRPQFKARFVYVDYFSYLGAYTENNTVVYGSPVLGIRALDELKRFFSAQTGGLTPTTTAILFEDDNATFDGLMETLQSLGYTSRIKNIEDNPVLADGDILVIHGDSSQYVDRVLKYIEGVTPTYSFHFIDPYGTKGVERRNIEKIISAKGADCIINMMLNYISRWMSVATKETLNPTEQAHAKFLDLFFGSDIWRRIAHDFESGAITKEIAEIELVKAYDAILHGADKELTVKQIPLNFQDREQKLYYLFLTTHDPTGACEMNEILADARIREYDYRVNKRQMRIQPTQLDLGIFGDLPDQKRPEEPQPDIDALAEEIYAICQKRTMKFRDVLREMCNSAYFQKDIKDALGKLRQQKRASFGDAPSSLGNNSEITFE